MINHVVLRTFEVSETDDVLCCDAEEVEEFDVEVGMFHAPELSVYPVFHISQIEALVLAHFCQFEDIQLRTIIFISFCMGFAIELIAEFM